MSEFDHLCKDKRGKKKKGKEEKRRKGVRRAMYDFVCNTDYNRNV